MTEPDASADQILRAVTDFLGPDADSLSEDDNLIEFGLDSIQLMQLANDWRRQGLRIGFAELAAAPTLRQWRRLLAEQPGGAGFGSGPAEPTGAPLVDPGAPFPLALMQHAYWIGRTEETALGSVAAHLYVEFDGPGVEPARLEHAMRTVVARHGMLRARFGDDGTQQIRPEYPGSPLLVTDLRAADPERIDAELAAIRDAGSHATLDVAAGEVFSLRLTLLPGDATRMHLDVDMLAADALSYRVLLADLARCYETPEDPPPAIGYSYPQYLADRAARPASGREQAREWWRQRLPELPGAPDLPLVADAERGDMTRVARRHHRLTAARAGRLAEHSHRFGLTPSMAVATAFAEVLAAWSGQPRFLLNVPLFDRDSTHPEADQLVGDFTGSVLLDVDLTARAGFVDHARALQARLHADAAHAAYSGVEVLRDLSRGQGEQVLAPVVFTSALDLGELFDERVRRCFGTPGWIVSQGPQVLLDAQITEVDGGYLINWDVREEAFPAGMVDAMFGAFHHMVGELCAREDAWTAPVPALIPDTQVRRRAEANDTAAPRSGRLLADGFFARAARRPDAPALVWDSDGALSYGELADRALRVAAALLERGVAAGDPVAVTLPKGPEQLVAVLGVLAAGAAYVPIGTAQPPGRRERIHAVAGFRVAIGGGADAGLAVIEGLEGVDLMPVAEALRADPLAGPVRVPEETVAYVLFTSGSTGLPKGVEVPHRAAMNTIDDLNDRFAVDASDRCLALSALDFDLSVYDVFGLLGAGGTVVLVDEEERRDARPWAELVRRHRVTVLNCVPALLDMLLLAAEPGELASLRVVLLGGDRVGTDLPGRVASVAGEHCRVAGLGGTTETAIHSTVCEVDRVPARWSSVPYGTPLRNVRCRVVDWRGRDCPDWVSGELWIGGAGVAHGYRADPDRTADRFVEHQHLHWYRTGDLARYWPDGTLEFLGRSDHQVKIRGMRIELGEVEAALAEHPGVRRAVALVAGSRLVAVISPETSGEITADQVIEWCRGLLPPQMVPARVSILDEFPLSSNGKIDRTALGALLGRAEQDGAERDGYVAPKGALERTLARIWGQTLGVERIGRDDRFFALGGDSVLATAIVARLRDVLDTTAVSVRTLFATLTVAAMAQRLLDEEDDPGRLAAVAEIYLDIESLTAEEVDAELSS